MMLSFMRRLDFVVCVCVRMIIKGFMDDEDNRLDRWMTAKVEHFHDDVRTVLCLFMRM